MSSEIGFILDGLILVFLSVTIFYAARLSLFLKYFREGRQGMQILLRDLSVTIDKAEKSIHVMKEQAALSELELREIVNEAKFLSDELRFMNETGDSLANRLERLADRNRELVDLMENAGGIGTQKIMPFDPASAAPAQKRKPAQQPPRRTVRETYESRESFEINDFEIEDDIDEDDERDFLALSDGAYREEDIYPPKKPEHHSRVNTDAKSKVRSFAIFDREYGLETEEEAEAPVVAEKPKPSQSASSPLLSRAEQDLYEALQRRKKPTKRVSEKS